jgi:general transcription factor 3C polypeptide 3 (transcription factor C subunit 4)
MRKNLEPHVYGEPEVVFSWQLLHNLTELYESKKQYRKAIRTIKSAGRWILGRASETWWDDVRDDSEFDNRRRTNKRFTKSPYANDDSKYELPIDIRVRLLLFRLKLNDYENDMIPHVNNLKEYPPETHSDLYMTVGAALQDAGQHTTALDLFEMIRDAFKQVIS